MTVTEKVAYLKGLIEGLDFDLSTKEGKIVSAICDVLGDIAEDLEDLGEEVTTLDDYADELDHDLGELEEYVYSDDECDCDCDDYDCDCGCDCDCDDYDYDEDYDFEDDDDEDLEFFEVTCPHCGETVVLDNTIDPSRVICPSCNKEFSSKMDN